MKNKYIFVAVLLLVLAAAGIGLTELSVTYERGSAQKDEQQAVFHVVTSFYPMYIAAENIIGDCGGVSLENLSEPQTGCLHDYQLTTDDMRRLSAADAFIINGGGIEHFLSEVAGQYPNLGIINASEQAALLEDNAHAWMSIPDYMIQVQTIADGLAALDEEHRADYETNCRGYLSKLTALCQQQEAVRTTIQESAQDAARIIIFHEAFAYTAKEYGFTVAGSMDLDEERQVSAREVADIVRLIREQGVSLILAEERYGRQMCEAVQKETDVTVVYLDTCVRGTYEADSYLRTMQENMHLLQEAGKISKERS